MTPVRCDVCGFPFDIDGEKCEACPNCHWPVHPVLDALMEAMRSAQNETNRLLQEINSTLQAQGEEEAEAE